MNARSIALLGLLVGCGGGGDHGPDPDAGSAPDGPPASACAPGLIPCDGACVDPESPEHCGRCGHACGGAQACDRGTCVAACADHRLAIERPQSPVGYAPERIAAGDLDGDGAIDVLVLGGGAIGATAMLGNGAGGFRRGQHLSGPSDPERVHLGDVDGDGDLDAIVDGDELTFLRGAGDGTFTASAIGYASASDAADLDGDGRLDLVAIASGGLVARFGTAAGPGAPATLVGYARAFAIGDADGDAILDVVYQDGAGLVVLHGDGDGGFPGTTTTAAPGAVTELLAADVVGDDAIDLLIRTGQVWTLRAGDGAGGFGPEVPAGLAAYTFDRRIADLDGDGKDDVIESRSDVVCVLAGGSAGLAAPRCTTTPRGEPAGIAIADVDGDGGADLIVGDRDAGTLMAIPVLGSGKLDGPAIVPLGTYAQSAVPADLDGDGLDDLVAGFVYENTVHVLSGAGGALAPVSSFTTVGQPQEIAVVDLDGGALDLLVATHSGIELLLDAAGQTSGATTEVIAGTGFGFNRAVAADVDGDTLRDLLVLDEDRTRLRVFLATAPGSFAPVPATILDLDDTSDLAAGDLTGDGRADLVLSSDDQLSIHPGQADGTFAAPTASTVGAGSARPSLHDLDGDGHLDVVMRGIWWPGDGAGGVGAPQIVSYGSTLVWVGDLDRDGHHDLLLRGGGVIQLAAGGPAGFAITRAWRLSGNVHTAAAADVDGDGHLDLLVTQSGGARLIPGIPGGFALDETTPAPPAQTLVRGDLDEDGRDDLVLQRNGGDTHVLLAEPGPGPTRFRQVQVISGAPAAHLVDADLDGHLDLVLDAAVYRGDGTGALASPERSPLAGARTSTLGFVDDDAYPDLLVQSQIVGYTRVWFGGADGFRPGPELPRSIHACAADVDGDGLGDAITAELSSYTVSVATGNGDGTFGAPASLPGIFIGLTAHLSCRDADGDGAVDVISTDAGTAIAGGRRGLAIARGDGDGLAAPALVDLATAAGTVDLALFRGGGPRAIVTGGYFLQVLDLDGGLVTGDDVIGAAVSGDFDGDAILDVAVGTPAGVVVYPGACAP